MVARTFEIVILFTLLGCAYCVGGPKGEDSDEYLLKLLKTSDKSLDVRGYVEKYGFQVVSEPFAGYYLMKEAGARPVHLDPVSIRKDKALAEPKIEYIKRLKYLDRQPRQSITVNDTSWGDMWHINPDFVEVGVGQFPSMNVYEAWLKGATGAGIHTSILDDGVEPTHTDLVPNYMPEYSWDYLTGQIYVNHTETNFHGTWCAGIVAAAKNNECVLGVAYNSKFSAVKIFDSYYGLTDAGEALALKHQLAQTDIYSNSWGPSDSGEIFAGPGPLTQQTFKDAIENGRDGKGAIFTWANGNGGPDDDCNCDGYANSIYTIAVTAVGRNQEASWYSEACSSVLVSAYAGSSPDLRIATTDTENSCTTGFQGTSASCPMAAGILALVLEARPELTWRDVQHLIVETASTEGLLKANWKENGAKKRVSHVFGFGMINALAMVERAPGWRLVPGQMTCESPLMLVNKASERGLYVNTSMVSDGCGIGFLEHVQVAITFGSTYRGAVEIILTSPQGTNSKLQHGRRWDYFSGSTTWTYSTVVSWGEYPVGRWTLRLEGQRNDIQYDLVSWQIIQYGTARHPITDAEAVVSDDDSGPNIGAIVGGTVGGVALITILGVGAYFLFIRPAAPAVSPS